MDQQEIRPDSLAALFERTRAAGIQLWVEGDSLRFRAPPGALTDDLRNALREYRASVIAQLKKEAEAHVAFGPLAETQHGLWFLNQLAPESPAYHVAFAARVHGNLDTGALERALQVLYDRHESLRTTYTKQDGEPVRRIAGFSRARIRQQDLSGLPEDRIMEIVRRDYEQPFDLEAGPVIRAHVYHEAADRHVFTLVAHHIAVDGTAMFVLLEELVDVYSALVTGSPVPARSDDARFEEFVAWQQGYLQGANAERDYWTKVLSPVPPPLDLPSSWPRPRTPRMRGASVEHVLDAPTSAALRALARSAGVTDYVLLLAVWITLLHRLTGRDDITVGAPVQGRPSARFGRTIGHFVNTLPLRLRDIEGITFNELVARTRSVVLDGMARQEYPLSRMVEQSGSRSESSGAPFQTMFALQDFTRYERFEHLKYATPEQQVRFGALSLSTVPLVQQEGQFDLSLDVWPRGDELACIWHYDVDLFEQSAVEGWTRTFVTLVDAVAADPYQKLAELNVIAAQDADRLAAWNATGRDYDLDTTLHELIEKQAERTPDAIAITSAESGVAAELSFGELNRRADALAVRLQDLGVGRDVPVAVSMERSAELVVALLAVLKAGGAYVPIDPGYPVERRTFMLQDSSAPVLLTQSAIGGTVDRGATIHVDAIWSELDTDAQPQKRADATSLAYIIYTSGSTGRPKGAMIEHRSIVNRLLWMQEHFGLASSDVVLQKTPYSFDVSVWEFFWPLMTGARLVMARPEGHKDPEYIEQLIEAEGVTTLHFVPSMLSVFLENQGTAPLPSLRRVVCSGEALSAAVRDRFFRRFRHVELTNLYGPTEAAVDVSWWRCTPDDTDPVVPIGRPVANTRLHILDEQLRPVPVGVPGELYIGGVQVGRGYLNRPELTAERFIADPHGTRGRLYRTGDKARYLTDGAIEFLGRLDDQVKIRGFRIELGEIEARLRECAEVRDVVVISRNERLVAYVVGTSAFDDLPKRLGAVLPEYMVPSVFMSVDKLPLSPSGKVDRKALPEPTVRVSSEQVAPRDPEEQAIAGIWSEILGASTIGVTDNFFALGGHSLAAARVIARVTAAFDLSMPLQQFFADPTVAGVATWVRMHRGGSTAPQPIRHRVSDRPAPLSFTQERLWFMQQLAPDSVAYNLSIALLLEGPLEQERLLDALSVVIRRHDVLRTTFQATDSEPVQVVSTEVRFDLELEDFTAVVSSERLERARSKMSEWLERPYRLDTGPLLRVSIARIDVDRHVLGIGMHHAISDQWSFGVLITEVATIYNGTGGALREIPLQYGDFAAWQREWLESSAIQEQIEYWKRHLSGLSAIDLPIDRAYPRMATSAGAVVHARLSPAVLRRIDDRSREFGVTPFVLLFSAWSALLYSYSRQTDFAIGVPTATRPHPDLETLIGSFLNVLPYWADTSGDPSFQELVGRVRQTAIDAASNQDAPFETIVQTLGLDRDASRPPLVQVLFNVANAPVRMNAFDSLRVEPVLLDRTAAQFELSLHVHGEGLYLEYNTDLFDRSTVERMLAGYCAILERGIAEPESKLADLAAATAADRNRHAEWNATGRDYDLGTTLHELVEAQAERTPDGIAVTSPESGVASELTFGELNRRANSLAVRLQELGVGGDVPVAVSMERSGELVVALLAVLKAGGAYVPIDPGYPVERRTFMLQDCGAPVLLTQSAIAGEVEGGAVIHVDAIWSELDADVQPEKRADATSLAYIIYTSGSTGRPKGAMIEHRSIVNRLLWMQEHFRLDPTDVVLQKTPYSFDVSVWEFFWPLMTGARLVMARPEGHKDPAYIEQLIGNEGVTTLHFVPSMLSAFLEGRSGSSLLPVKRVVCSGEALSVGVRDSFRQHFPHVELTNLYGPTEAAVDVSWYRCSADETRATVPIGWPVANTQLHILDDQMQPVPVGVPGELYIGGVQVGRGYLNRPELTAERFIADRYGTRGRLYRTGDKARYLSDGAIEFLGRLDDQVKIRGFRIELGEIETRLREHPGVRDAFVIARGEQLVAYTVGTGVSELHDWTAAVLPEYMVPSFFVPLDSLPLTPNGKVDRKALPAPTPAHAPSEMVAPRDADEEIIAQIWRDVLGQEQIGVHENFFVLGGHSLSATQVVARVREAFELELPLRHFFEHPTIADAADWIRTNHAHGLRLSPLRAQENATDEVELSFAQERMWLIQKLAPESVAYNVGGAVLLEGSLDVERFRKAVNAVVAHQEGMRTHFPMHTGVPMQALSADGCDYRYVDLESVPEADRQRTAETHAVELIEAPYDLENGPLARFLVARLSPERHVIAAGMHHIIADLWSFGVLGRDLAVAYDNPDAPLPPLPVTYRDYSVWQRGWLNEELIRNEIEHWRERLAGVPNLELPTDHPRSPFYSFNGGVVQRKITPELRAAIEKFSSSRRLTPFMFGLGVFNALLSAHTGQTDIAVGVPIANRTQMASEHLIGTFVNTLVHRNDTSGDPTVHELLQRVRTTALDAYANQDVPFDLLVKELQPPRDASRPPVFQVLFNVANADMGGGEVGHLKQTVIPLPRRTAQFDLAVDVALHALDSSVTIAFNTALFEQDTAERLLRQYVEMLERAVASPDIRLSELQRVSGNERKVLLDEWNATDRDYPSTARLTALFAAQAHRDAGRVAVESPTGSFTYGELLEYAQRVTAALQQIGVKPGDRVAIVMQRSREMLGALLGILGSGASYVPVDPNYPDARVRYMLEDSGAVAVVTHRGLEREYRISVPILDLDRWTPPAPAPFVETTREQAAYVIYTSGSTGKPKGVEVPHGGVANFLLGMQERPGLRPDDAILAVTTISFDIAVLELYLPLITGARVVIAGEDEALDGRRLMQRMESAGITVMQATPATWKLLLAAAWEGKPDLRILCGGEPLPRALADSLLDRVAELWNMYGPTETTVWSTVDRIERDGPVLIGRPIANTTLYVLREDLEPVPIGVPGELYIGGAGVANGYVNRPDLTAERFLPDPFRPGERMYRTGDLVRYRTDGRVEHLGRLDHQVKVRGFRIELGEIESALRAHEGIRDVAVAAVDDRLIAYIVGNNGGLPPAGELRRLLSASLPQYMLPSVFVPLDALPLTPNGKIDRKRLPAPATEPRAPQRRTLPSRPAERTIAEVWASLLQVDEIGVSDNFFELGGHSLLAMQAVAQIEERTGVRIEPRSLFFRTLGELADALPEQATT